MNCLKINFGEAFGSAHDIGGIDRLVGGNQNESFHAVFDGEIAKVGSPEGVILDGFAGLAFHHRDVFVRGGVENHVGAKSLHHVTHARVVENVRDDGKNDSCEAAFDELLFDLEHGDFGLFDQKKARGIERSDLAAKFAADAAARASDRDDAIGEDLLDVFGIEFYGRASKQVLNFDVAELADFDLAGGKLINRRNRFETKMAALENFYDFADALRRGGRHSDDDFFEFEIEVRFEKRFGRADNWDIVNARMPFGAIVVEEHDWCEA